MSAPHYFSNGTERYAWQENWCDRCTNDHGMHNPDGEAGCEILALSFFGDEPIPQWLETWDGTGPFPLGDNIRCIEFSPCRACGEGDDGEEPPVPIHPDQGQFFDPDSLPPGVPRGVVLDELVQS